MLIISAEAVENFDAFRGVVELFTATTGQLPDLQEWSIINMLIGDMILLRNGRATVHLAQRIKTDIGEAVAGDAVFALLAAIADRKIEANDLKG